MKNFILDEFKKKYPEKKVFIISSATREGIEELVDFLIDNYSKKEEIIDNEQKEEIIIYDLKENKDPKKVEIEYL
jgi:50S ribosomal subunit-associated GTPase HflX